MSENPPRVRVALVTGASRGIGLAAARRLAAEGARTVLVARGREALEEACAALAAERLDVHSFPCDVADAAAVERLRADVEAAVGPVDVLVNNAGGAESAPFARTDLALLERMLRVNLVSTFLVTQAFLPGMTARGAGRVVNVASTAAKAGMPYVSAYCAAKHAVLGLTRALAQEVAAQGVTVNAVCPSYVDTPMTERTIANIVARTGRDADAARAAVVKDNPQRRLIAADEVAAAIAYLASDAARGVNGQALNVCGGQLPV